MTRIISFFLFFFCFSANASVFIPPASVTLPKLANDAIRIKVANNLSLTAAASANALTVTIKDTAGANLSANDVARFTFRNTSLTAGTWSQASRTSNLTLTVPQNATLGLLTGSIPQYVWVYALNDAGTLDVCVSGVSVFSDANLNSSSQISSGATSGSTLYCSLSHSGAKPTRILGNILVTNASNLNWTTVTQVNLDSMPSAQVGVATIVDSKASGTAAQTITAGSYVQRTLNTLSGNQAFISLATNQITLVPGTYTAQISCPWSLSGVVGQVNSKCKLRNVTGSSDVFLSNTSTFVNPGSTTAALFSIGSGTFTISAQSVFEVDQQVSSTSPGGTAASFGDSEIYTQVEIRKLDYYGP